MRTGKVRENILKRSVLPRRVGTKHVCDDPVTIRTNPVEGWTLAAPRAVFGAVNALAAQGAVPLSIALTVLMPEGTEERQLKQLMKEIHRLCEKENISVAAGHTAVTPAVNNLVLSVTGIGKLPKPDTTGGGRSRGKLPKPDTTGGGRSRGGLPKPDTTGGSRSGGGLPKPDTTEGSRSGGGLVRAGMDIVMIGHAGREGAALLATDREDELKERYAPFYIDTAKHFYEGACKREAARILFESGAIRIQAVREGGVFGSLWELASCLGTGIDIDLQKIPIRQHTIEICEFFDINPYMLLSGGCLLAVCPDGKEAIDRLAEEASARQRMPEERTDDTGYHRPGLEPDQMAVIGKTAGGNDRIIHYDGETRYLEPPKMDQIYKIVNYR